MVVKEFMDLDVVQDMTKLRYPEVGMKFLFGGKMIAQKESKTIGNEISWYEVVSVKPNGDFGYAVRFGRLKKSTEET